MFSKQREEFLKAHPPSRCAATARHVPERFTYDDDGNLLSDGRLSYTRDGEPPTPRLRRSGNRLVAVETLSTLPAAMLRTRSTFQYDGQSRRIGKTVETWSVESGAWNVADSRTFLYDGWNLVQETITGGTSSVSSVTNHYTWGIDLSGTPQGAGGIGGLLAVEHGNPEPAEGSSVFSPTFDANGNVMSYHDHSGLTVAAYEYDPFGRTIEAHGPMASEFPYRFSTKYTDEETGLVYYGYRYYNPELGRWINRDPIEEQGGLNVYVHTYNSPVVYIDINGLSSIGIGTIIGQVVAWFVNEMGWLENKPDWNHGIPGMGDLTPLEPCIEPKQLCVTDEKQTLKYSDVTLSVWGIISWDYKFWHTRNRSRIFKCCCSCEDLVETDRDRTFVNVSGTEWFGRWKGKTIDEEITLQAPCP